MIGESQTTGTCNHWMKFQIAKLGESVLKQRGESLADIGIVSLIIGEQYSMFCIQDCNFNCSGTDIDSQCVKFFVHV